MITFELVALDGLKFSEEVYEILLPTPEGQIAILPHHMPLVSLASDGVVGLRRLKSDSDDQMEHYAINGGVVEITRNRVRVLVDEADAADEISQEEAEAALERAKPLLADASDQVSLEKAQSLVRSQQNRLRVAELAKRRRTKR